MGEGRTLGERAFIKNVGRSLTAVAVGKCFLVSIGEKTFYEVLAN